MASRGVLILFVAVFTALTAGAAGIAATGTAQAGTAVTCPAVASGSGIVTPAPTPGVDWSGCDLAGADFGSADLTNVNLSSADVSFANLTVATVHGTNLSGANLTGTNAYGAQIVDANLSKADLESFGADHITDSDLTGADISNADFSGGAIFAGIRSGGLTDANGAPYLPDGWTLQDGYLLGPGVDFSGVSFPALGANAPNLSVMNLANSDFGAADMTGVDLKDDNLSDGQFAGTNLTDANLYGVNLAGSSLQGAKLTGNVMTAVESGAITGTPAELPANWTLNGGYLLGPDAGLTSANLAGANLTGTDLAGANLYLGTLADASLTDVNLDGAYLYDTDLTGATWSNTTCPDGTNSDADNDTCANNFDLPPVANPAVSGPEKNGWYTRATVAWHWSDAHDAINPAKCVTTTASASEGAPTRLTATCSNTAGVAGRATVSVDIENTGPVVTVTGVANGRLYAAGHVPAAGCHTTDRLSGVARAAAVTVTSKETHGAGSFTATCAGAVNRAGIGQAASVRATYTVAYGVTQFLTPKNKSTVPRSRHVVTAAFKLSGITAALATKLAAAGDIRVSLTGPGISPVTVTAVWQPKPGTFSATLHIPSKVETGKAYLIAVRENVGTGPITAPPLGAAVNPEAVRFS